jgi:oligoribonuclease NrnB/cAMP/cGMP phosphodiesterase (DHH superfamily)
MYDYLEHIGIITDDIKASHTFRYIVHLIATYDTWDWHTKFNDTPVFERFNRLFDIYTSDIYINVMLTKLQDDVHFTEVIDNTEHLLLTIEDNRTKAYLDGIEKSFKTGNLHLKGETFFSFVLCTSDKYMQETFKKMKDVYADYDLYIINYGTGMSIRTDKDSVNVGAITKLLGGGGHPGAGGFKIPFELQKEHLERVFDSPLYFDEKE